MHKLPSKSRIDKAGAILSQENAIIDENYLDLEETFEVYRRFHLTPLTKLSLELQKLLESSSCEYYLAQRLKRKPQILRKLRRFKSRLTQLQDIGGARIILENNNVLDEISELIDKHIKYMPEFSLHRNTDYRPNGRDDSGYRALHKIVSFNDIKLEIQLRTRAQHYWAESIERTSVFYGKRLKEGEGDSVVIRYFKMLSNAFSTIEEGFGLYQESIQDLSELREQSEEIIRRDGHANLIDGVVNEDVVKTLVQIEKSHPSQVNNWILVFDWRTANFVMWDMVSLDASEAVDAYSRYERDFPEDNFYEVVLIGSSSIATVQKTHSHYFGISSHDEILETFGQNISKITDDPKLNGDAIKILARMHKKKIFGMNKGIQRQTLKNHFCKDVKNFEQGMNLLITLGYIINKGGAGVTLDISRINEIEVLI